jgi:hypothetical protein
MELGRGGNAMKMLMPSILVGWIWDEPAGRVKFLFLPLLAIFFISVE